MSTSFSTETFMTHDGATMRFGVIQRPDAAPGRTPIVFVPGLGGSIRHGLQLLTQLVPEFGPIYGMDGRGFGINDAMRPSPNPASYLRDFAAFVRFLRETHRLAPDQAPLLMGLSLGGVLSTQYLAKNPDHPFNALVLVSPAFKPHPELFPWRFRLRQYVQFALKGPFATTTLPYGKEELTRNLDPALNEIFRPPFVFPSFYLVLVDLLCRRATRNVSRITIPTAILVPERDKICDPMAMKHAGLRLPQDSTRVFCYPHLYHDILLEPSDDQVEVLADLRQWIHRLGPTGLPETAKEAVPSRAL